MPTGSPWSGPRATGCWSMTVMNTLSRGFSCVIRSRAPPPVMCSELLSGAQLLEELPLRPGGAAGAGLLPRQTRHFPDQAIAGAGMRADVECDPAQRHLLALRREHPGHDHGPAGHHV